MSPPEKAKKAGTKFLGAGSEFGDYTKIEMKQRVQMAHDVLALQTSHGLGLPEKKASEEIGRRVLAKALSFDLTLLLDPVVRQLAANYAGTVPIVAAAPSPDDPDLAYQNPILQKQLNNFGDAKGLFSAAAIASLFTDLQSPLTAITTTDLGTIMSDPVIRWQMRISQAKLTFAPTPQNPGQIINITDLKIPPPARYFTLRALDASNARLVRTASACGPLGSFLTAIFPERDEMRSPSSLLVASVNRSTILSDNQSKVVKAYTSPTCKDLAYLSSAGVFNLDRSVMACLSSPEIYRSLASDEEDLKDLKDRFKDEKEWKDERAWKRIIDLYRDSDISTFESYTKALVTITKDLVNTRRETDVQKDNRSVDQVLADDSAFVELVSRVVKATGARINNLDFQSPGSKLNLLESVEKELSSPATSDYIDRVYTLLTRCARHGLFSFYAAGTMREGLISSDSDAAAIRKRLDTFFDLFRKESSLSLNNLDAVPYSEAWAKLLVFLPQFARVDGNLSTWYVTEEETGLGLKIRKEAYKRLVNFIGRILSHTIQLFRSGKLELSSTPSGRAIDLFCFSLEIAFLLDLWHGASGKASTHVLHPNVIQNQVLPKFTPYCIFEEDGSPSKRSLPSRPRFAAAVDAVLNRYDTERARIEVARGKAVELQNVPADESAAAKTAQEAFDTAVKSLRKQFLKCTAQQDWVGFLETLFEKRYSDARNSAVKTIKLLSVKKTKSAKKATKPASRPSGSAPAPVAPPPLLDALLADPEINRGLHQYYTIILQIRHFFRSHFESLPVTLRDYALPSDITAADAEMERCLQGEAVEREAVASRTIGSKARVIIEDPPEILDDLKQAEYNPASNEFTRVSGRPRVLSPGEHPDFPHPAIYHGLKHVENYLLSTRAHNFQVLSGAYSRLKALGATDGLGGWFPSKAIWDGSNHAIRRAKSLEIRNAFFYKVLEVLQEDFLGTAEFVTAGRVSTEILNQVRKNVEGVESYIMARNYVRAFRNHFDHTYSAHIGHLANRGRLKARFARLEKYLVHVVKKLDVAPEKRLQYEQVIHRAGRARLLLHFSCRRAIIRAGAAFFPHEVPVARELAGLLGKNKEANARILSVAGAFPSFGGLGAAGASILLGSLFRAFAVHARLVVSGCDKRNQNYLTHRAYDLKFTRLVYAHELFNRSHGFLKLPQGITQGFLFLVRLPALLPDITLSDELSKQVSAIIGAKEVRKPSFTTADDARERGAFAQRALPATAEPKNAKEVKFSLRHTDFKGPTRLILSALAALKVFKVSPKDLASFIFAADQAWIDMSAGKVPADPFKILIAPLKAAMDVPQIKEDVQPVRPLPSSLEGARREIGVIPPMDQVTVQIREAVQKQGPRGVKIFFTLSDPVITEGVARECNRLFADPAVFPDGNPIRDELSFHLKESPSASTNKDTPSPRVPDYGTIIQEIQQQVTWMSGELDRLLEDMRGLQGAYDAILAVIDLDDPTNDDWDGWLGDYGDACLAEGLDAATYAPAAESPVPKVRRACKAVMKALEGLLGNIGRRRNELYGDKAHAEREIARLQKEQATAGESSEEPSLPPRRVLEAGLRYLGAQFENHTTVFSKYLRGASCAIPDQKVKCAILVSPRIASKIAHGARVDSIKLLPSRNGRHVHANICVMEPAAVTKAPPRWATILARVASSGPSGGYWAVDHNRLVSQYAFTFSTMSYDSEMQDVPGTHLAMLFDLWRYPAEGEQGDGAFNTFWGNKSKKPSKHEGGEDVPSAGSLIRGLIPNGGRR